MSKQAHQAYSTYVPDSYLANSPVYDFKTYLEPLDRFSRFKKLENRQGEAIYITSIEGTVVLATSKFTKFIPLVEEVGLPDPTKTQCYLTFVNADEFIWLFDTYGLEAALKGVQLPPTVTLTDLLVTEDLPPELFYLEETSPAENFVTTLNRLRRNYELYNPKAKHDLENPYLSLVQTLTARRSESYINTYTVSDLVNLLSNYLGCFNIVLEVGDFTYFYVPNLTITSNKNIISNFSKPYLVKTNLTTKEWIYGFLRLGGFDSIVRAFVAYHQLKLADKPIYSKFFIEEIGGKQREIHAPAPELNEPLKGAARILAVSYEKIVQGTNLDKTVVGFRPRKGIKDNALIHYKNKYIIKMDIKSFFKKVKYEYYQRYLRFLLNPNKIKFVAFADELEVVFREILEEPKTQGLYMGNPLSPALTNLLMRKVVTHLDNVISSINIKLENKISYSIYADDITFSCDHYDGEGYFTVKFLTNLINDIFAAYKLDLQLNRSKTNRMKNNRRFITGIRVNHLDQLSVSRKKYEKIRLILHRLHQTQDPLSITMDLANLQSRLSFYLYIDTSGKMERLLRKYEDTLNKFDLNVGLKPARPVDKSDELINFLNEVDQQEGGTTHA